MAKQRKNQKRWNNIILIFRMMLRYWHYLVAGFICMLFFTLFNGVSVTLAIPLFDYVFKPGRNNLLYTDFSGFLTALGELIKQHFGSSGGFFAAIQNYNSLWEGCKKLMLQTDSLSLLYGLCVAIFVIILLKNGFYLLHKIFFNSLRGKTIRDIRNYMFTRYLNQSLTFFGRHRVGDAIVRMVGDVDIVSEQLINSFVNVTREIFTVLVFARIAYLLNPTLLLYSIIVLPVFSFSIGLLGKKIKKYSKRIQEQISNLFSNVEEVLNSMKVVQAFRREDYEKKIFESINQKHYRMWYKAQYYGALNTPIAELNTAITGILVIIIGGNMILAPGSNFSLGDFTAFLFALFSMLHPLKVITQVYTDIRKALVSLDRIGLVLNQESRIQDKPDAIVKDSFDREISFENVTFGYKNTKPVLKNFNLTISKGSKVAFVGSSGGGKTTIANLMNRLYDVNSGAITIDGIDIRDIKLDSLRKLFGVVTQESILFSRSIKENIAYGSQDEVTDEQIIKAAQIAYADEFIDELPNKYEEVLSSKGSDLSGGQKQRLCIARAIVGDPPILIFDEATSALDTDSEQKVQLAIDKVTLNRTVILIAHRLSTILKADQIVVLEKGKIVGIGTHQELLESCSRYQHLYNLQNGK
ncbi:MAG TPA: ABC transporter ATP-binding protein [Candidatus Cloacimonas sp.]|mgnify:FL=1|nr:ABC transporter ATP-binding protein [Candidatus Cloacimonadota bacterium]HNZ33118.1 ABC transporter ATP-binding protein [Candidatus Cloacimonas sp.]HPN26797.1 ABC transporter ATP-binding protein [Candidatus Cloacimonas sp.]HPZ01536.1 ABC transporter ATP-binding protein [Candidatus Cloacimonas sp.]HQB49669.1 ABC transporter ATP-binding protein [Candidatus Cloacimonas sp.]